MADEQGGLEERLGVLEKFLGETRSIEWAASSLRIAHEVLRISGYEDDDVEPAKTIRGLKVSLAEMALAEDGYLGEYDKMMWKGKFSGQDGWNYFKAMAEEMGFLPQFQSNPLVVFSVDGTDQWNLASATVLKRRERFLEPKMAGVDKNLALALLVDAVKLRVNAYQLLAEPIDNLLKLWGVTEILPGGAYFSKVEAQGSRVALPAPFLELSPYIQAFPMKVATLKQDYSGPELVDLGKSLSHDAQSPLKG